MLDTSTTFLYEESDIPEGLTLHEWRRRQSEDSGSTRRSRWPSSASFGAVVAGCMRWAVRVPKPSKD